MFDVNIGLHMSNGLSELLKLLVDIGNFLHLVIRLNFTSFPFGLLNLRLDLGNHSSFVFNFMTPLDMGQLLFQFVDGLGDFVHLNLLFNAL